MKRRDFLKTGAIITAATTIGITSMASAKQPIIHIKHKDFDVLFSPTDKTYAVKSSRPIRVDEIYTHFKKSWYDSSLLIKYPFSMMAVTHNYFEMNDGYRFTEDSFQYFTDASIKQGDDFYAGITILGYDNDNDSYLVIDGVEYHKRNVVAKCNNRKAFIVNGDVRFDVAEVCNLSHDRQWYGLLRVPEIPNNFIT